MGLSLYINAVIANIITFVAGMSLTWTSPILPKLSNATDDNPLGRAITADENSWITGLMSLGAAVGPFIFAYTADLIGRKLTLLSLGFPFIIAYLMLTFSKIVALYYVARVIVGVAVGGVFTVIPMYLGEIAENSNRGAISSMMNVLLCFGLFISYCIGPYLSILVYNLIIAILPGAFLVLFFFVGCETPQFYIIKGREEDAKKSLDKLRGPGENDKEYEAIKSANQKSESGIFDLFKSKATLKAFFISLALVTFQQFSGINCILFFAQDIFQASGSGLKPEIASIIIGAVQFSTAFVTPLASDRLGRKLLLYTSALGMLISEVPLGVYFYLKRQNQDVSGIAFLPILCLVLYIIFYNFGFGPLPWAIMGELFPSSVKSTASSLTAGFCWFLSFLLTKFFQQMADGIGMGQSFWIFAGFCAAAFIFTFFIVIETKGKSLQEIQEALEA